jgi:formylmethanofuran dehydrogenase subunit B
MFTLITGRTLEQGRNLEIGKFTKDYLDRVAICEINPEDLKKLGVESGSNVKVKTAYGEVVVKAVSSTSTSPGVVFILMGPWANTVVNPDSQGSGMPTLKGIPCEIKPTTEPIPQIYDLLKKISDKTFAAKISGSSQNPVSGKEATYTNVVCCFCGCICDDIEVTVKNGKVTSVKNACAIGMAKLLNYDKERAYKPMVRKNGKLVEASLDEALEVAAKILVEAKYPLIYGWSSTSNEAMRIGVYLAELTGGVVDNTSVCCHGPTILGTQQAGVVKATLGQMKNRADLIVYWGCNPVYAHPRHTLRYSAMAKGRYVKGRKERKVVVVDVRPTPTSKVADMFIQVKPGMDYELITALRMAVKEHTIEAPMVAGVPREKILELADMLRSAKFGVIFLGMGLTMTVGKGRNLEEAIKLVQDLNEWTKFVLLAMRGHYNVAGTNEVIVWLTGYPYAVDFMLGYPRHNPGITSSTDVLIRGDVDAALIVASDPASHFPRKAVEHLAKIPTIVIDPRWSPTASLADVFIPAAYVGIECEGTVYRMDGIPLRAKKLVEPPPGILSDEEVLGKLVEKVEALKLGR